MSLSRVAAVAATLLSVSVVQADEFWVFLGTNTGKDASKGIYRSKFDSKTGKLSEAELAAEMGSPSFLTIHPNGKFLYAVGAGGKDGDKDGGAVVAFSLDAKTGKLEKLNEGTSGGGGPCHISVDPKGEYAAVANYGGGSTALFKLGADGKLGDRSFVQHKGTGPNKGRQEGPHAHCTAFTRDGGHLLTVDLGTDRVKAFDIHAGKLVENEKADIATPAGSGPRHIAIAPDGKFAYVCGELDSTVNVIEFGKDGGKVIQSLPTLKEPVKNNSTAECILSPDGKFVYVSNRVGNTIAAFKVGEDRKLTVAGHITGDIKIPRNFNIDPSGKWMLIASQDGGKVGVWELDAKTGLAKETGDSAKVSKCVCVKFVPVAK